MVAGADDGGGDMHASVGPTSSSRADDVHACVGPTLSSCISLFNKNYYSNEPS
jgi:hypothetical protein